MNNFYGFQITEKGFYNPKIGLLKRLYTGNGITAEFNNHVITYGYHDKNFKFHGGFNSRLECMDNRF